MKYICMLTFSAFLLYGCSKQEKTEPPTFAITAQKAEVRDVDEYIASIGTLEAFASVDITAQVDGILTHILFKQGEFVEFGKLLFTLDPRTYEANLESAKASLEQDKARLNYAQQYAHSYTTLAKENYVSRLSAAEAVQNVDIYQANIQADLAAIQNAQINLDYTRIKAALSGYISLHNLDVGNYVPKDNTTPLATIKQVTPIKLNFSIPATNFEKVRCAQAKKDLIVKAFLQNNRTSPLEGTLKFINNTVDEQSGMILLQAEIPNKDERGWPGQFVNIELYVDQIKNAVIIPTAALQRNQNGPFVFVVNDDMTVEIRQIIPGFKFDKYVVVEKGLQGSEVVATDGQLNLSQKAKVKIVQADSKELKTEAPQGLRETGEKIERKSS